MTTTTCTNPIRYALKMMQARHPNLCECGRQPTLTAFNDEPFRVVKKCACLKVEICYPGESDDQLERFKCWVIGGKPITYND
jgi:hypothetical protein